MKGQLQKWRSSRCCIIWSLQRVRPKPLSNDVIRYLVQRYLSFETCYCWLCLRSFCVHIGKRNPCALYKGSDMKPVCCRGTMTFEILFGYYETVDAKELLQAYDFLSGLANATAPAPPFGSFSVMQKRAVRKAHNRKKAASDRARRQIIAEQQAVEADRKQIQRIERQQERRKGRRK